MIPLHGLGGAQDLPVPAHVAITAGSVALVASFVVLVLARRRPRYDGQRRNRPLPATVAALLDSAWSRAWWRAVGFAFFGFVAWALFLGPDDNNNPVLGVFYVLVWVGVVPTSLLFGRVARALSPVRTIDTLLGRVLRGDPSKGLFPYPARLGSWPAAIGLFWFVWQELVDPDQVELSTIQVWVGTYVVVMLLGCALFGDTWLEHADPFEVYSDLVAKLSIWGRDGSGRLVVRRPLANLATVTPRAGLVAVVAVLFGSTAFDSYKDSLSWVNFVDAGTTHVTAFNTAALVVFCLVVGLTFTIAARATMTAGQVPRRLLPSLYAHSVVPIVVGYMTAHYLSYFVEQGQETLIQLSDPMVRGANYFGTAGLTPDLWLSAHPSFLADTKVIAVVVGHIVGIIAAHDRALTLLPAKHRITGQLAMVVLMVGYTVAGLSLLFAT